jgi:hypothetical protein
MNTEETHTIEEIDPRDHHHRMTGKAHQTKAIEDHRPIDTNLIIFAT